MGFEEHLTEYSRTSRQLYYNRSAIGEADEVTRDVWKHLQPFRATLVDRSGVVLNPFGVVESVIHAFGWLGPTRRTGSGDSTGSMSRLTTTGY